MTPDGEFLIVCVLHAAMLHDSRGAGGLSIARVCRSRPLPRTS
jgi:hypothetical protein